VLGHWGLVLMLRADFGLCLLVGVLDDAYTLVSSFGRLARGQCIFAETLLIFL
jgi:hypothetical protein